MASPLKFLIFPKGFHHRNERDEEIPYAHVLRARFYLYGFPLGASVASNVDAESNHTSKTLPSSKLRALPLPGPFKTPVEAEFSFKSLPCETISVIPITVCFCLVWPYPVACAPFSNSIIPESVTGSSNV